MSCNELGWENLSSERTPIVIIVASSTGDGDSPDNAAKFYATMKCDPPLRALARCVKSSFGIRSVYCIASRIRVQERVTQQIRNIRELVGALASLLGSHDPSRERLWCGRRWCVSRAYWQAHGV